MNQQPPTLHHPTRPGNASIQIPHLELTQGGKPRLFALGDTPITIGRAASCDLQIDSDAISREHALVTRDGRSFSITDLGSSNGTYVNYRPLQPHVPQMLLDGDTLNLDDPDQGDSVQMVFRSGAATLIKQIDLAARPLTLGRVGADILLEHPLISAQHLRIEPDDTSFKVTDLHSTNGTFLNGQQVEHAHLQAGDRLQLGGLQLVYQPGQLFVYARRGAHSMVAQEITRSIAGHTLLHPVSFRAISGQLVALVGASGAGKSTLLSILSGSLMPESGEVLIGGINAVAARTAVGFVPQTLPLHGELPLGRALQYVAQLRLPPDTSSAEIERRITAVLQEVGLRERREIPIRQLSGGQQRRAAIASELLVDPTVLLLDEPTAGLDPGLERRIFELLRDLANPSRIIVVATHATGAIGFFDQVVFLAQGRLVYAGLPARAPAAFDIAGDDFAAIYTKLDTPEAPEHWERRFQETLAPIEPHAGSGMWASQLPHPSRWRQLEVLTARTLDLLRCDRRNLMILLAQAPAIGLLLAIVARSDALVGERAAANEAKKVLFMLATTAIWCGVINAARAIAAERPIFLHEQRAGLGILPYLGSKLIALSPLLLIQTMALLGLVLLKVHIPAMGIALPLAVELFISTLLAGLTGLALGLAISSAAKTPDRAISLVPLAIIPQILLAGVIFSLGDGVTAQRALSWLASARWAMDALGASANLNALPLLPGLLRPVTPAPEYAATLGHLLSRWAILLGYTLICMIAAGVALRRK